MARKNDVVGVRSSPQPTVLVDHLPASSLPKRKRQKPLGREDWTRNNDGQDDHQSLKFQLRVCNMFKKLKEWWAGKFIPTPLDIALNGGDFENIIRPWPVRAWRKIIQFCAQHWQFLVNTIIAIVGIVVAATMALYIAKHYGK
ncbi:MAG: hypothetical protein AB1545_13740 [Thermodesulfobacteriota bacterium]